MTVMPANAALPTDFPVAVLLRYHRTPANPWTEGSWSVDGIVVGQQLAGGEQQRRLVHSSGDDQLYLCSGFRVRLFPDEAESYYYNLMAGNPAAFVLCQRDDNGHLSPREVTLSYAEATSYMEMEEEVCTVALPAELYRWLEYYVLEHYLPQKRRKRKREDWKKNETPSVSQLRHRSRHE